MNIPRLIFHLLLLKSLEYMTNDTKSIYWQPVRKAPKFYYMMACSCSAATADKTPTKGVCRNQPYSRKEALCSSGAQFVASDQRWEHLENPAAETDSQTWNLSLWARLAVHVTCTKLWTSISTAVTLQRDDSPLKTSFRFTLTGQINKWMYFRFDKTTEYCWHNLHRAATG